MILATTNGRGSQENIMATAYDPSDDNNALDLNNTEQRPVLSVHKYRRVVGALIVMTVVLSQQKSCTQTLGDVVSHHRSSRYNAVIFKKP